MRLGEIHQWLYNKIIILEEIENEIVRWAVSRGLPADQWQEAIFTEYGKPTEGKPLKKIIDKSNIHNWLLDRVDSVELRQAALITLILKANPQGKAEIIDIYAQHGRETALEYQGPVPKNPEELYILLNDYVLEGMPTDRVNEVLSGNENVIIWRTVNCLHKPYWDRVNGDIANFYTMREAWIKAFIETLNSEFIYEKRPNGDHKIVRR